MSIESEREPHAATASSASEPRAGWGTRVRKEIQDVGLVTLYFAICFGVILTLKKLYLADHQIEFYALSVTLVSALIAGKVAVILEHTSVGTRFDKDHPLGLAVGYKTALYTLVALIAVLGEKLVHTYRDTGHFDQAVASLWVHRDRDTIIANVLCVCLAFVGYHFYAGLDRRLGEGRLRQILWKRT